MKKKVLFVAAEAMPFAATGGLGDVIGSLPAAIVRESQGETDVRVVIPLYRSIADKYRAEMSEPVVFNVPLGWRNLYCGVRSLQKDGVTYYFVDNEYYFSRDVLYGQYDDGERYAYFCMAVLEMMPYIDFYPDVLHAHDWQAALSIVYLNQIYRSRPWYGTMRTVFSIHNIEYQGKYGCELLNDVFSLGENSLSILQYDGCLNLMKGAIQQADRVLTVSPRYAEEIMTPEASHGLWHILRAVSEKTGGILNGIDYDYYNPSKDTQLANHFSSKRPAGKKKHKAAMQAELGLEVNENIPMVVVITRLVGHKGVDLIREIGEDLINRENMQLVVLGCGEYEYEEYFRYLDGKYHDRVRALITYNRDLAKKLYAAADIFLMPSRNEPCGLAQMIASRYGAIPVVRETGGLYDSIKGFWQDDEGTIHGNGFTFANYSSYELEERTLAAINLWKNEPLRKAFIKIIMETDFSWSKSAKHYIDTYNYI